MKAKYFGWFALVAASAFLALRCAESPPVRDSGQFFGAPVPSEVHAPTSQGSDSSAPRPRTGPSYPFEPKVPGPVPLPSGQGSSVKLQKYVVIDQFGYRPTQSKVAVLVRPEVGWSGGDDYQPGSTLEVKKWSDGTTAFKGPVIAWNGGALDERSGDRGSWFDFSPLHEPGTYYVFDSKNGVRSHPFEIADDVYRRVLKTATRMYYFNRANFEKKPPYSCVGSRCWSLAADYVGPGQDREARSVRDRDNPKTARDLSGGWWDAGDTNKYVTFAANALHPLLTAYTEHPSAFSDDLGIPESGNGTPDLIDEVLVELRWLEKMQPADLKGGALIKVGVADYGEPRPDQSKLKRFYYPEPCSAATISVAGEFAHAAVILSKLSGHGADAARLSERAKSAFDYYQKNPRSDACDDGSIKAGDADVPLAGQDALAVIAAVYLFELTGDARYDDVVKKNFRSMRPFQDDRWSLYEPIQGDALLRYAGLSNADAAVTKAILDRKRADAAGADFYKFEPQLDLYRAYMHPDSYHWGSNSVRAAYGNNSYDLVQYGLATDGARANFTERAAGMLHSFHGVNPMQLVYLSNMYADGGDECVDELYHAWFRAQDPYFDNARRSTLGPAPGYVPGGPNRQYCEGQDPKQHACASSPVRNQPPEKAYVDTNVGWEPGNPYDKSWELTEPAIYYQAAYVRLLSKFVD